MRNNLLLYFFLFFSFSLTFSQSERDVINYIDSINSLALSHYKNNDIMQSFNYFNESIKLSDSINDSFGNAVANFTLGRIYNYMQEYKEAERCFTNMLNQSKEIDDNYLIANSYLSLGELYTNTNNFDKVIPYYKQALKYALKKEVRDQNNLDKQQNVLFDIRMNLSKVYIAKNNPNEAFMYLLRAESNLENVPDDLYSRGYLNYVYGLYFINKLSFNKANDKFHEAISYLERNYKESDSRYNYLLSKIYKELSLSLSELGVKDEAYYVLLKHNDSREKFINVEKIKQDEINKSKLYLTEYKRVAQSANSERILMQQVNEKIKNVNLIITLAIVILGILLLAIYRNYRSKRKLSDILKARNKLLEVAKNQAEKSSKLKTAFISNVTHELRTPLYGVVGLTSLLLNNNDLSEKDNKYVQSLKYSGDYLLSLVNDILQIGKMESGKVELKKTSVNLKVLINNLIDSFEYRLQENKNEIHITIDDSIPEYIICDKVRLSQVLINLIGNSIKFTKNGKIWLRVLNLNIDDNNVSLRFEVEDNGPGIPKEKHEIIFENFSQLNENNNVNYQGTGLGLSIAKNLVELIEGKIELESTLGEGSTFSFNVTFKIDKTSKEQPDTIKNGKTVHLKGGFNILIAEDNKINQIVTQNLLQKANYKCQVAQNGLEALNAVKENSFDLILMDINMPVMNGNEATREVRKINPNIPIIALTAADIDEVKKDYKIIGYNGIITKPFDNYEFFQIIETNIQQSKLNSNIDISLKVS